MSDELARLYQSLELKVQEKTRRLQQANETLEVLYRCSQALSVRQIDQQAFENVLRIVRQSERLRCIRLNVADDHGQWQLNEGEPAPTQARTRCRSPRATNRLASCVGSPRRTRRILI